MNAWKAILAALVIFGAGVITGGLTVNLRHHFSENQSGRTSSARRRGSGDSRRVDAQLRDLMHRMEQDLNLAPEQRERIEKILSESRGRIESIWQQIPPEFQLMRGKIRTELTPEQQKKFELIFKAREEWHHRPATGSEAHPAAGAEGAQHAPASSTH